MPRSLKKGPYVDEKLYRKVEQLNQMTRELLMFARGDQHILLRKVFLHKFMSEVQELLEPELDNKGVKLEIELAYKNDIKIDQVKLKRAILNLARNAAEAMGERGGTFRIHVSKIERGQCELFEEEHVLMKLSDNGPGIPESIRDRLFESFVTQGKKDGTGLGLAIVRDVAEIYEGTASLEESEDLGGLLVRLRLPAAGNVPLHAELLQRPFLDLHDVEALFNLARFQMFPEFRHGRSGENAANDAEPMPRGVLESPNPCRAALIRSLIAAPGCGPS